MNMQLVNADYFVAIKNRTEELQQVVHDEVTKISTTRSNHEELKRLSFKRKMYLTEFDALFPTAPVDGDFVTENNKIAALQAEIDALIAAGGEWNGRWAARPQETEMRDLKSAKAQKIADYHNGRQNLGRSLTDAEFTQLYPEPTDSDFIDEQLLIDNARAEIGQLHDFLQSGTWPKAGLHDVDLLAGTAISYP